MSHEPTENDYVMVVIEEGSFDPKPTSHGCVVIQTSTCRVSVSLSEYYMRSPRFMEALLDKLQGFQEKGIVAELTAALRATDV